MSTCTEFFVCLLLTPRAEFDDQVITLTRLLVDSLNEKAIESGLDPGPVGEKGISKLSRFLVANNFSETESVIGFLRNLQELRSAGSGHRKGSNYHRIIERMSIDLEHKQEAMADMLSKAGEMLLGLRSHLMVETPTDG